MNALKRSREIKYGVSAEHRDLSVEGRAYIPALHAHTMWHEIIPPSSWTSPLCSLESCASKSNRCIWTFHLLLTGTSHQSLHTFCLWKQVACTMHTHLSLPTWSLVTAFKNSCLSPHKVHQLHVQTQKVAVHSRPYHVRNHSAGRKPSRRAAVTTWALALENCSKLETLSWHRSGGKVGTPCPARTRRGRELARKTWGTELILPALDIGGCCRLATPHLITRS